MRTRAKREIGTIIGVGVILLGILVVNTELRRAPLKEQMIAWREATEKGRADKGTDLLSWSVLQKTTGSRRSGPTFHQDLVPLRESEVNLVGFMVPLYEFREVSEFLLLPMPIECYFCESPPMRDVVLVEMGEGKKAGLVNDPVLVSGTLVLNEGPDTKFFYEIRNAAWGAGKEGSKLTKKSVPQQHRAPQHGSEPLVEGSTPPAGQPTAQDASAPPPPAEAPSAAAPAPAPQSAGP